MPRPKNPQFPKKTTERTTSDASFISPIASVERPKVLPLTYEERVELRGMLHSPVFRKAWNNVLLQKPSVVPPAVPAGSDAALLAAVASNRLNQLYGWEQFAAALLAQIEDQLPKAKPVPDNYGAE